MGAGQLAARACGVASLVASVFAPALASALASALVPARVLQAQTQTQPQSVLLEIRPRTGDTLHIRLDQRMEMTGTTSLRDGDTTTVVRSSMLVQARAVVQRSDGTGTTVLTLTDSVALEGTDGASEAQRDEVRRGLQGRRVLVRIGRDGSARLVGDPAELGDVPVLFGEMPPTFPTRAVRVGEQWDQVLPLPLASAPGTASALRATFRLDSLSADLRFAYVSMRGSFSRDSASAAGALPEGTSVRTAGVLAGSLRIDRRRGWLTSSRTTITVKSVVTPPRGSTAQPMRLHVRVTQHMRTMDKP